MPLRIRNLQINTRMNTQESLFGRPQEKGSAEWSALNTVREAKTGMFRVAPPPKHVVSGKASVVSTRKYKKPHQLFPKPAH